MVSIMIRSLIFSIVSMLYQSCKVYYEMRKQNLTVGSYIKSMTQMGAGSSIACNYKK